MIVVTVATGHISNALVRELIARERTVCALVLHHDDCRPLAGLNTEIVYGDVADKKSGIRICRCRRRLSPGWYCNHHAWNG